jgi:uncharacterized repeat protein (TIGR03803 family)
MNQLSFWKTIGLVGVFCAAAVIASPAQTFTTLVSFNGTDGSGPDAPLVQGLDGNFYGTNELGGPYSEICSSFTFASCGTVFKITPGGTLTTLYSFCSETDCLDGWRPSGLFLATDGNVYGTTLGGGPTNDGTLFKITSGGTLTTLQSFDGTGLAGPSGMIQATDGNFYGVTLGGGPGNWGAVIKITPGGALTTLHIFDYTDGAGPNGVVQATDGNFYGTTVGGGTSGNCASSPFREGCGTVFKITPGGTLTTLHSFDGTDGANPSSVILPPLNGAGLVQATDGNFYGTTLDGGLYSNQACSAPGCGTVFKITPGGTLTTLYSFCAQTNCTDGANPGAGLVQGTDGNFYGTTSIGGAYGYGTVFRITPGGTLTTLHSFDDSDGASPGGLVQATDGSFYGITGSSSGADRGGTVFSLAVGLGPFVKTLPTSGEVGATVIILGTDLMGATGVTFDGIAAAFTVVSSSEITTAVPSGAATGKVRVTTPQGTLVSNLNFGVAPTPSVISVTPAAATGPNVTFALTYSAAPGAYTDLEWARVLFKGQTGVNVCRVDYYQPCEEFFLESDTGTWLGPLTAGSAETLSNSQCTLNGSGTTVVGSGSTLTLNLSLTAASGFVGEKEIDMWVNDIQGNSSGWQTEGTWTPAPETAPAARRSPSR